jgi:hypothetical protein
VPSWPARHNAENSKIKVTLWPLFSDNLPKCFIRLEWMELIFYSAVQSSV